jgi:hypothetical protein
MEVILTVGNSSYHSLDANLKDNDTTVEITNMHRLDINLFGQDVHIKYEIAGMPVSNYGKVFYHKDQELSINIKFTARP